MGHGDVDVAYSASFETPVKDLRLPPSRLPTGGETQHILYILLVGCPLIRQILGTPYDDRATTIVK